MNYEQVQEKKRLAIILSLICPGAGLLYFSNILIGLIHFIVHIGLSLLAIYYFTLAVLADANVAYANFPVILCGGLVVVNWGISLLLTATVKENID